MLPQPLKSFKPYILRTFSTSISRKYPSPMATASTQIDEAVSTQDKSTQIVPKPIQVTPFGFFFFCTWHLIDGLFQIDNFRGE